MDEIITRCKTSDTIAQSILYENYSDQVFRTAFLLCKNKDLAEDITQETFIRIFSKLCTFKGDESKFSQWLYSVTLNVAKNTFRKQRWINFFSPIDNLENIENLNKLDEDAVSNIHTPDSLKTNIFLKFNNTKPNNFSSKKFFIDLSQVAVIIFILLAIPCLANYKHQTLDKKTNSLSIHNNSSPENHSYITENSTANTIDLYDINGDSYKGKMLVIKDPSKVALGYNKEDLTKFKTTSELAKENKALCAINAGCFKLESPENISSSSRIPYGIMFHDGKLIYSDLNNDNEKSNIVAFNIKGRLIIGSYSISELKNLEIKEAVTITEPLLIINGKSAEFSISQGINPRTAIGQKADGSIIFLVIDGRSQDSIGSSLDTVQKILLENGAINACILDGGSSTTMFYNGAVINHPCNEDGERAIPSAFIVLP